MKRHTAFRLTRLSFIALAACAAASLAGCRATTCAGDSTVRVGTYNIRFSGFGSHIADKDTPNAWEARKADMVAFLRGLDLDVFGLQEVCPDQAAYLRETLPEYTMVGDHREADRKSGEASPVCYRTDRFDELKSGTFWLSETPDVPGVNGWGAACPRVCSYLVLRDRRTGRRFCFANTHTDHVSAEAREKGMLLVIERMKEFGDGCPIVFTGDHNCRETEAPAMAVSKLLANAMFESETAPSGPWRTFNGWAWRDEEFPAAEALKLPADVRNARKGSPDAEKNKKTGRHVYEKFGPRIDYIYVTPGTRVLDYATRADARPGQKLYPSDHFAIVATVEIP
ncbi:MAG: endonuclease/exonuclease/phosphatase family protein [Kiritimatiellae bacterium]|nr:endonuclease/exonuclease/phosphatase family protein [Kiritimatiellia bacterium]